jgi:hypothetical protein
MHTGDMMVTMGTMLHAEMTKDNHRLYNIQHTEGIRKYPSVTTIFKCLPLSPGLQRFKEMPGSNDYMRQRAVIGTTCHFYFESVMSHLLDNHVPELEYVNYAKYGGQETWDIIRNINLKIDMMIKKHNIVPYKLEMPLWSDKYEFAGRIDFVGWVDGELCILDLKTAKRFYNDDVDKYAMQLSAYKHALMEREGMEATKLYILRVNENNMPEIKEKPDQFNDFLDVREFYRSMYDR